MSIPHFEKKKLLKYMHYIIFCILQNAVLLNVINM